MGLLLSVVVGFLLYLWDQGMTGVSVDFEGETFFLFERISVQCVDVFMSVGGCDVWVRVLTEVGSVIGV